MAEQVPTSGFIAQPAVAPSVPSAAEPGVNGNPITSPNQTPGWLPQGQAAQPAPAAPAGTPAAPTDMAGVVAMLQAALAGKTDAVPVAPPEVGTVQPAWLEGSINEFDISTIDDPIIKSMATVMQVVGKDLDLDRVMGKALSHGDISLIDLAYLREKGGDSAPQLAEIAKGIVQAVSAKADAVMASVYDIAGGEAGWGNAVAAFNTSAPQELRITVTQMLNSTNENFIKAGAKIVSEFGKSSGMIPQAGAPLLNASPASNVGQGLTKAQFQAELVKLRADTPGYAETREALFTRRALGKRSGN